ncbi:MAG TPA: hypothetical protein PLQ03_10705 [Brevundimonas sp.]|uniref:hypothetical protein n=1 Tax=uncultured Brevundimonas sp. TaxID=213418 RepID=UPI00260D0551|nr:hypothetical protein [uncultured Brevundimonas sp.]HRO33870.1 hypothetical protein [Brevundimonas sp.]
MAGHPFAVIGTPTAALNWRALYQQSRTGQVGAGVFDRIGFDPGAGVEIAHSGDGAAAPFRRRVY